MQIYREQKEANWRTHENTSLSHEFEQVEGWTVGEQEFNHSPVSVGREHKWLKEKGFESLNLREEIRFGQLEVWELNAREKRLRRDEAKAWST